tara:strand:+ start:189 stop:389 length:201 start_codon:yes stop_codon:yes gene_type:complete
MGKPYMSLQPTEVALLDASSRIYAAHIASGAVADGAASDAMKQAIADAFRLATLIDEGLMADAELD